LYKILGAVQISDIYNRKELSLGPLMLDVQGLELTEQERAQLASPAVGGLILFKRNFSDIKQLKSLVSQIRSAAGQQFIIAVDHEGGRVQRFRAGFSHIPAMGKILPFCQGDLDKAKKYSQKMGWLMAIELLELDIDISFAPVLDLDICSNVIGDRAFSDDPTITATMASAFIDGMGEAGMACTGKHFPGHGSVVADSHIAIPVDEREQQAITTIDRRVFEKLIGAKKIDALMPAHVIYPAFCDKPAGFSPFWLQTVLRQELAFNGVLFSDDLGMEGASVAGGFVERAQAALAAGCDMVLVCNEPSGAMAVQQYLETQYASRALSDAELASQQRLSTMLLKRNGSLVNSDVTCRNSAIALAKEINR